MGILLDHARKGRCWCVKFKRQDRCLINCARQNRDVKVIFGVGGGVSVFFKSKLRVYFIKVQVGKTINSTHTHTQKKRNEDFCWNSRKHDPN